MQQQLCEEDLIDLLKVDCREGLSQLYDIYSPMLYGQICKKVNDTARADLVLQNVFMHAWRTAGQFDSKKQKLFTWLYVITESQIRGI